MKHPNCVWQTLHKLAMQAWDAWLLRWVLPVLLYKTFILHIIYPAQSITHGSFAHFCIAPTAHLQAFWRHEWLCSCTTRLPIRFVCLSSWSVDDMSTKANAHADNLWRQILPFVRNELGSADKWYGRVPLHSWYRPRFFWILLWSTVYARWGHKLDWHKLK